MDATVLLYAVAILGGLFLGFTILGTMGSGKKSAKRTTYTDGNVWARKNRNW